MHACVHSQAIFKPQNEQRAVNQKEKLRLASKGVAQWQVPVVTNSFIDDKIREVKM